MILRFAIAGLALAYGGVMIAAAAAAYRQHTITRGAWITMTLGGGLLALGALTASDVLRAGFAGNGIALAGIGLYLISDAAYAVGTQRPNGPRLSHHAARAGFAVLLVAGLLLTR